MTVQEEDAPSHGEGMHDDNEGGQFQEDQISVSGNRNHRDVEEEDPGPEPNFNQDTPSIKEVLIQQSHS